MCGICGIVTPHDSAGPDEELLRRMCRVLVHRGPDGEGFHFDGRVGFGHRRLKVIDLKTGDQPMFNEDRSVVVVFNGEIYNFRALRDELVAKGHRFSTRSDTEVIVHLYEEMGTRCVDRLRGMFAFALWDVSRCRLFAAVDRVGKKPFHYMLRHGGIRFASEMKALLADPAVAKEIHPQALDGFLSFQYVPAPDTILKGIRKLPAGHALSWSEGKLKTWRYWDLEYEPKHSIDREEAVVAVEGLVDEAVRLRLESDVPLGAFLSGGVDSSLVVAMMRRHVSGSLKTFSIGFGEQTFNELPQARQVAERFETDHQEFILEPDAVQIFHRMVWHLDEPMADKAALPTWYLSEMTRRHVTVALNGDGGDESFAGYTRYVSALGNGWYGRWSRIPRVVRQVADASILPLLARLAPGPGRLSDLHYLNWLSLQDNARRYVLSMNVFRDNQRHWLYTPDFARLVRGKDPSSYLTEPYRDSRVREEIDRLMYTDIRAYLPGALLPKVDRMTMAFGLEGRSPLLDHRLMEFAARLPGEMKAPDRELKVLLRRVAARSLPSEWLDRPKHGFSVPIEDWFRGGLREWAREILTSRRALERGFFNPHRLHLLLRSHETGQANHAPRIWALLCLEHWCRLFLDRADISDGPIRC